MQQAIYSIEILVARGTYRPSELVVDGCDRIPDGTVQVLVGTSTEDERLALALFEMDDMLEVICWDCRLRHRIYAIFCLSTWPNLPTNKHHADHKLRIRGLNMCLPKRPPALARVQKDVEEWYAP